MNKEIENKIISSFIISRKRDRAKYELWNNKKRKEFIWNLGNLDYIDIRYIKKLTQSISSYQVVYDILKNNGALDECYVLAFNNSIDGKFMPLKSALKIVVFGGPAIISSIHGTLAYVEGEVDINANRLILKK